MRGFLPKPTMCHLYVYVPSIFFIIASLLIQKGIMSSSALSKMLVKCDYCGKEMLKKNLKDHTNSIHGPNKAPRD